MRITILEGDKVNVKEIKTVWLSWPGDPSVGIPEREITIHDDPLIDFTIYAEEDRPIILNEFARLLANAFEVIEDGRPKVMFDFEDNE